MGKLQKEFFFSFRGMKRYLCTNYVLLQTVSMRCKEERENRATRAQRLLISFKKSKSMASAEQGASAKLGRRTLLWEKLE